MGENNGKKINRRRFLKTLGGGVIAATALDACDFGGKKNKEQLFDKTAVPTDKMTYRTNHNTGDKVSLLGYGCMRWPLRTNANGEEEIDQDAVNELVDYAIAHGVNYFDTAPVYVRGWSEKATGIALSRHPRESYFIATKSSRINTLESGIAMYRKSMEDLQVDYLDYYLLHNVGKSIEDFEDRFVKSGLLDFFIKERKAGRIRNLGWSFHGITEGFDHVLNFVVDWDFCMIQLNYQDWKYATGMNVNAEYLYGELVKRNIPAIIMEPLLGGRLGRVPIEALTVMKNTNPDDSPAKWAFRYAGTPQNVLTVLSGMVYMEHLQENIRTYSPLEPINEEEYKTLERVTEILVNGEYIQCTECQYCMPCPYGLDIPATFAHYNRCITEGYIAKDAQDENYRKARRAFLIGYDRSVPKLRQANHCINCNKCLEDCPQRINIPEEMNKIDRYVEQLKING
ncbi:aldo/keto reductase [Bacteroidales bacterium OttesenSCG-928-B11]|nr:aldo/keto reductase [Bacteroidales bacterium OttesenSCG-928-E04]MDL2308714.1 aldo/keto reductase [Bacteroidales bacterium OttesenSCG-928-C03]MDL2311931.1 aldo/keto reductase [Bacteroidales bacterium OttesenSCG-928-B11]